MTTVDVTDQIAAAVEDTPEMMNRFHEAKRILLAAPEDDLKAQLNALRECAAGAAAVLRAHPELPVKLEDLGRYVFAVARESASLAKKAN